MIELDTSQDDLIVDLSYGRKTISGNKLDFSSLNVSVPLAHGLKYAFEATLGGCSHETKKIAWRHIRLFCSYLVVSGLSKTSPLPSTILVMFSQWLVSETSHSQNYKAGIVNQIVSLILWCYRNTNELIHSDLRLDLPRLHSKKIKSSASNLNEDEIKKILSAAYKDIDEVINRIRKFREMQYDSTKTLEDLKIHKILMEIGERGSGLFISDKELSKDNSFKRRVKSVGGLDKLSRYLYPSSEDIFPFYLAILCQCSGNPMSMRLLTTDNIQDHPLRSDRQRIVWSKTRSGYEQKADFNSQRSRSAPNLVNLLSELTKPLVPFATNQDRKMVFLAYRRGIVSVPCWQMLHIMCEKFIIHHDLSDFTFKDLRRAGASLHQKASGSILAAKKRLNHRSSHTTLRYITEEVMQELNDKTIAESQNLLHANVLNAPIKDNNDIYDKETIPADTLFGFKCKNPFAGIAPSTYPGSLCTKFTGCATCPGSIIPLDDPVVISRLLKTLEQLRLTKIRAIEQGWIERYLSIYEPTQKILEETIIPKVTPSVKAKALLLIAGHSIPYLE
jgi:hypothetical protein